MGSAIIFDMDGTLFQTNKLLEPALEATFDHLRKEKFWEGPTPINQYREIMGVPLPVVWQTLCPNHSIEIRNNSNTIFHKQLIHLIRNDCGALYPGVQESLHTLSKKHSLFIASNGQTEYLQAIVETYDLNRFIQSYYSIEKIKSGNKSDLIKRVIEENNLQSGYVVGDRISDFKAAKDNELISIGVRFDFSQEDELKLADYVVDSFLEILSII